ncbi:MAG TPA: dihydrofolate reductase family protein [Chloroflexota bacterium]|nr:dihydrofolate reductase family protein [Chloroflexota bacterium]
MLIRARIGVSVDGFIATPDGRPAILAMPDFVPGVSYGHPEFIEQCDAVVMGRTTFEPALQAPRWPWPGKQVYVLTSRPLPAEAPADVIVSNGGASELLEQLRAACLARDVHVLGGSRTIQAFRALGALDRLEILALPILLGDGIPLSPPGTPPLPLQLDGHRTFPGGTIELVYSPA